MGASLSKTASWLIGPDPLFKDVVINGGQFIWARTVNHFIQQAGPRRGLKLLTKRVIPSAMHDSAQRVDPPKCHPNTRDAILEELFQWLIDSEARKEWVLWINGAAGAGKSAIAQTIAEKCAKEKIAIASFFFSKMDFTRDNAVGLVATLAYQLIQQIPETEDHILRIIEQDPLILEKSLASQLFELILGPLDRVHQMPLGRHFIFVIDGLDECKDKEIRCDLIQEITNLTRAGKLSVIFLIASRLEPDIVASFKALENTAPLVELPLDDVPLPQVSEDIRNFLHDKFSEIKCTHPIGYYLPENWPPSSVVERIIAKSSGQFIYASLAVIFISSPRFNPVKQLEIIDGIRSPSPLKHPFAHRDALYRAIFAQIDPDHLNTALNVIAYTLLTGENRIAVINWAFQLAPGDVEISLSDLAAVITWNSHHIELLHGSLSDFLLDSNRSGEHHIDAEKYTTRLACIVLSRHPIEDAYPSIIQLLNTVNPSVEVQCALLQFNLTFDITYDLHSAFLPLDSTSTKLSSIFSILIAVKNLNFGDHAAYYHFLDLCVRNFKAQSELIGFRNWCITLSHQDYIRLQSDIELYDLSNWLNKAHIRRIDAAGEKKRRLDGIGHPGLDNEEGEERMDDEEVAETLDDEEEESGFDGIHQPGSDCASASPQNPQEYQTWLTFRTLGF